MRRPPDQRWSSELIAGIKGSPAEPRPGSGSDRMPTYARQAEEKKGEEYKDKPEVHVQRVRPARITRSDLEDHGRTPSCKACTAMHAGRPSHPTGGHAHSHDCRLRFEEIFRESGAEKLKRADTRMNEEIYRQERQEVEGEAPRAEEENNDEDMAAPDASGPPPNSSSATAATSSSTSSSSNSAAPSGASLAPARLPPPAPAAGEDYQDRLRRKRAASEEGDDGSHDPGRPGGRSGQAAASTAAAAPTGSSTQGTQGTDSAARRSSSLRREGSGPEERSPARSKRPAIEDPEGERAHAYQCTDALNESPAKDTPLSELAKQIMEQTNINKIGGGSAHSSGVLMPLRRSAQAKKHYDKTVGSREVMQHPGPVISANEMTKKEKQWQDIGSGVFARSFEKAQRLLTTTRGGPPIEDVHRRTVWSLSTGRVIDDRIVDDTSDLVLNRWLDHPDDIRVELTMKGALNMFTKKGPDVSEVYSQPRVTQAAAEFDKDGMKLKPGWSLDLTRADPATGKAWDLSRPEVQARAMKLLITTKPLFLIGSPPCTAFSPLQNLSKGKRDPAIVEAELKAARVHLDFCMRLYKMQVKGGRFFVHEHPHDASSWNENSVKEVMNLQGVDIASVDMCVYGMRVNTGPVQGPARKRTRIMSNSRHVLRRVACVCPSAGPDESPHHRHVPLESGRAKRCQVYPR